MTSVARRYGNGQVPFAHPSRQTDDALRAPVVLMVSGGADSTALLVLAATSELDICDGRGKARIARERLHVLHVNHGLRGIDADEDEEFVRDLAATYGIPCTIRRVDVAALASKVGDNNVENAGREVRYQEAARLANELSAQLGTPRSAARILTAHTADDRAETFFMNAIRGTGASGLSSIPRRRNRIVRPLLDRTHEELCEFLRMRGIVWREDQTNSDTHYLRAFVRHEVMPMVEERNPRVVSSLATTCDILSDENAYLAGIAGRTMRELTLRRGEGFVALDAARLAACDVAIARRVVRMAILAVCPDVRLEARHVADALRLVAVGAGSVTIPMGLDVRVEHGLLMIRSRAASSALEEGWLEVPGVMDLHDGRHLVARLVEKPEGADPVALARSHGSEFAGESVLLDAEACEIDPQAGGRLWVGSAQPGDVMCPLGMHGQSKKLSDLLGEARVPVAERPAVPIVRTSPTGSVIWVAGIRADERSCCTPTTRQLLELSLQGQ
ncbi:MAG: tRNA lysidine(34) synthetase TilS [Tractidigestivibacter sp.]|jgi:tRNA(Ile)-lysidine synthase|uniref:tRNA lysidine(34) synthetase TilS n=1 Tax=Tractidigestivibacter sp. TaxID=2847320 RepID=UPI003D8D0816